jgi:hypothetical protein
VKEEVTKLIETMCSKLGVGVETVWSAMLRQAPLWGCSKIAAILAINVLSSFLLYFIMRYSKKHKVFEEEGDEMGVIGFMIFIISVVMIVATMAFFINDLNMVLASFFNPEYWSASILLKLNN